MLSFEETLSLLSLIVTTVGIIGVYVQIKKVRQSIWSNTHSNLCDQSFAIIKFLSDSPGLYPYFYRNKEFTGNDVDEEKVAYASEILTNFLEHLVLQRSNLPKEQWIVWENFIRSSYENSQVMVKYIIDHKEWYTSDLLRVGSQYYEIGQVNSSDSAV